MSSSYPKIAQLKSVEQFRQRLQELHLDLPVDDQILAASASPLAQPVSVGRYQAGNRWCIHPMEGWDARPDGSPGELTVRRWARFGQSGAKLIWGGEAAAVRQDGRANPHQTLATAANRSGLRHLLDTLLAAHRNAFHRTEDLVVGLQLTHSGRFCRPTDHHRPQPRILYHHPLLDQKFGIQPDDDSVVWTDDQLEALIDDYLQAARLAHQVGFHFVDVKACHGYLLHESLSAFRRRGRFGGDYAGRTRLLKSIVQRIGDEIPELYVGVRLSVFDSPPFQDAQGMGRPMDIAHCRPYDLAFGVSQDDPLKIDLTEPIQLLRDLKQWGVMAVNVSAGSPYYSPHIQRPAIFPPSDGYAPPEDPLVGVERQIQAARRCKQAVPELLMVGTGYTYLQDYLPQVAQAVVRQGWIDIVGLGRMVLAYPELPADSLAGRPMRRKSICRTFSDCTTAPRNNLESGCYPLDAFYKQLEAAQQLRDIKARRSKAAS